MEPAKAMDRRTRVCIWIIILGLANFLAFTIIYMFIGGEAVNGWVTTQAGHTRYFVRTPAQEWRQVGSGVFWYSGLHSISIWVTVGAIMLAMLTLAKDRIVDSMHSTVVRGRTFLTILATVITMIVVICTIWSCLAFSRNLTHPEKLPSAASQQGTTQQAGQPRP